MQSSTTEPGINLISDSKRHRIKDYRCISESPIKTYVKAQDKFLRKYNFDYPAFRDFVAIHDHFKFTGTGINAHSIIRTFHETDCNFRSLYFRLKLLNDKGLIYSTDHKYFPTDKALKELNTLLKSA